MDSVLEKKISDARDCGICENGVNRMIDIYKRNRLRKKGQTGDDTKKFLIFLLLTFTFVFVILMGWVR